MGDIPGLNLSGWEIYPGIQARKGGYTRVYRLGREAIPGYIPPYPPG